MIRINGKDIGITVSGHAQRLPGASPGHNIICAGVSALTLTLIEGLREVAGIEIQESVRPVTGREDEKSIRVLLERTAEAKKIADEVYRKVKEINDVKNADAACCIHKDGGKSYK